MSLSGEDPLSTWVGVIQSDNLGTHTETYCSGRATAESPLGQCLMELQKCSHPKTPELWSYQHVTWAWEG